MVVVGEESALMPKSTRVVCRACRAQLGVVLKDRLTVEGRRVDVGPRREIVITCMSCKAVRPWTIRRGA
jgi:RNase P subunit RPR2